MSMIPPVKTFLAAAEALYNDIRDVSKTEAVLVIAAELLKTYGAGGTDVLDDMHGKIQLAATDIKSIQ